MIQRLRRKNKRMENQKTLISQQSNEKIIKHLKEIMSTKKHVKPTLTLKFSQMFESQKVQKNAGRIFSKNNSQKREDLKTLFY